MVELRRFHNDDADAVWELHNLALDGTAAHLGDGPWDDDLRSIPVCYLQDGGEFIVGLIDGRLLAMGGLRHITDAAAELKRMRVHAAFQRRALDLGAPDQPTTRVARGDPAHSVAAVRRRDLLGGLIHEYGRPA